MGDTFDDVSHPAEVPLSRLFPPDLERFPIELAVERAAVVY